MEGSNNNQYIPYLDGCRGVAILFVVLSHAGLGHLIPGKFGVTFFFFISGFLITKLLLNEMDQNGRIRFANFYLRRLFRLYPALIGMIIMACLASLIIHCDLPSTDVYAALFYYTNYYIGWVRTPVEDCKRILDIIWSLSVEEHFYIFFPFLLQISLRGRSAKTKKFVWILFAFCLITFLNRVFIFYHYGEAMENVAGKEYFSTHTRVDSILWGCIASVLLYQLRSGIFIKMTKNILFIAAGLLLLLLSLIIRKDFFLQTMQFSFQGIGLLILVPALGFMQKNFIRQFFESAPLVYIGKISYSLYLFHWISAKIANHAAIEYSLQWQLIFWSLAVAGTLLSFYLVEKPFVSLRRKFGSHAGR